MCKMCLPFQIIWISCLCEQTFFIDFDSTVLNRLRYFVIDIQVEVSFWLIQVRKTTENKKSVRRELTFPWNISNAKFILYAEGISFV